MVLLIVAFSIVAFIAVFAGIWCATLWAVAALGGWRRLADACPMPVPPPAGQHRIHTYQTIRFSPTMGYNRSLNVSFGKEGIRIEVSRLLRPFHPPILVPWKCVAPPEPAGVLIRRPAVLISAAGCTATLYLPRGAEPEVARLHEQYAGCPPQPSAERRDG